MTILIPNLPLAHYVDALIGSKEYAIIDDSVKDRIDSAVGGDPKTVAVVENGSDTLNHWGETLPVLRAGLYRLWTAKVWEVTENKRKAAILAIDNAHAEHSRKKAVIMDSFVKIGMTREIAAMAVGAMNHETIEQTYRNISATSGASAAPIVGKLSHPSVG